MVYVNKALTDRREAKAFVLACETDFLQRLTEVVRRIVRECGVECVTLSGPTCSGKTTTATKLTAEIEAAGKRAVVVSIDDFFKERLHPNTVDYIVDYDTVDAIDLPLLAARADKLVRGISTTLPVYDFVSGTRSEAKIYNATPDDIIIFEGIQAVYPEVVSLFSSYSFRSVYISVSETLSVNGTVFAPDEIRLARRIVRDARFRSASPEFTFHMWKSVRENEEKNIAPHSNRCDYRIDSLLSYEPFMIAPHLLPLLATVPADSPYASEAKQLAEKYRVVGDSAVTEALLPEFSLYHEFLG